MSIQSSPLQSGSLELCQFGMIPPSAVRFVRSMRGGAQCVLVECTDGAQYVVKSPNNPQGANVLFNEALGTELMRSLGLPVPDWRPIYISSDFLNTNPGAYFETSSGRSQKSPGLHFGSLYVAPEVSNVYEILPKSWLRRVVAREEFLRALVLDLWVCNRDRRQALFLPIEEGPGSPLRAVFFDNGHMFGGPEWTFNDQITRSLYADLDIYDDLLEENCVWTAVNEVAAISMSTMIALTRHIPAEWLPRQARLDDMLEVLIGRQRLLPHLVSASICFLGAKLAKNRQGQGGLSLPPGQSERRIMSDPRLLWQPAVH